MFEAAEVGRKVSKQEFKEQEPGLHTDLLTIQRALRESDFPVIIIVSGVEGAGKGEVVNRLNYWLDARGMQTFAYWDETDEERQRPRFWRFWRSLPPRGTIGILFGSWYTRPIIDRALGKTDAPEFGRELSRINEFERALTEDGALIVKFWFHLSKEAQQSRLRKDSKQDKKNWNVSPLAKKFAKSYKQFFRVSEQAIRETDTGGSPWHIIEAEDRRYRDLMVGKILLKALQKRLGERHSTQSHDAEPEPTPPSAARASLTVLDHLDLSPVLSDEKYDKQLLRYQRQLNALSWKAREKKRCVVAMFEGWDAGGKGGAIRRITAAIDARLYRVISVAAPTDEEKAQHYLWRFWRQLPRVGYMTIYDRSWYGRVLVERVEGFASQHEWMRAYQEINDFEQHLADHGTILLKYWLHISKDEQLRRFKEREKIPWKAHKITDEDWRNREKWDAYGEAVNEMVAHTSTEYAPWNLIPGNDKRYARVEVLKRLCKRLKEAL